MSLSTSNNRRKDSSSSSTMTVTTAATTTAALLLLAILFGSQCNDASTGGGGGVHAFASYSSQQQQRSSSLLRTTLPSIRTTTTTSTALSMASSTTTSCTTGSNSKKKTTTSSRSSSLTMTLCDTPGNDVENDQEPFELHVGRALDTLRTDYAKILTENPDFKIYSADLEVIDPSKVKVHGLRNYKAAFNLLHAVIKVFYCPQRSTIDYRICYDKARQNIRIHWNAHVVPREIFGGTRTTAHVDGISVYAFDRISGNITQHRIEHLLINDQSVRPREGVIAALRSEHADAVTVPSFIQQQQQYQNNEVVHFHMFSNHGHDRKTSLFALDAASSEESNTNSNSQNNNVINRSNYPNLDWDGYESKNKSRKKFGLKPLSPEEFLELQAQVEQLSAQQQAAAASAAAEKAAKRPSKNTNGGNIFDNIFKGLQDTCESNFDCERPEVCCDFGFQKRCCSSGTLVGNLGKKQGEYAMVPVPVETGYPEGRGPNDQPGNYARRR